jgi:hypothetical protein
MESDRILARAEELLNRVGDQSRLITRERKRQLRSARTRLGRMVMATIAIALGAILWGVFIAPLQVTGVIVATLLFLAAFALIVLIPRGISTASDLPQTQLAMLPLSTEEWLAGQRRSLPAPAQRIADSIGLKLETLSDQLRGLNEKEPAAAEVRRLIADDLPELVSGYQRVPAAMRKEGINGMSPDKQLIDGLALVDSELQRMSVQIASGDLNKLATQGRYLEIKYQGDS